jgi:hypothetical protein
MEIMYVQIVSTVMHGLTMIYRSLTAQTIYKPPVTTADAHSSWRGCIFHSKWLQCLYLSICNKMSETENEVHLKEIDPLYPVLLRHRAFSLYNVSTFRENLFLF